MTSNIFCCPLCKSHLETVADGLQCHRHGLFKNYNGVISFLSGEHNSFEEHWTNNEAKSIPLSKLSEASDFLRPIKSVLQTKKSKLKVLDAGCGNAVHAGILEKWLQNKEVSEGNTFVGIDLSLSVLMSNAREGYKAWSFYHADITQLPFVSSTFDVIFSYGVLCYTNDPAESLKELCRCLNTNGIIGVWVYPRTAGISNFIFQTTRKICQIGGKTFTDLFAAFIIPFLPILPTKSKVTLFNSTWKQCREVVLVNISPEFLIFPTVEDVKLWFEQCNCEITFIDENNPITIWGQKKNVVSN
jgi:SAM-dependent methyltransferase